MKIVISSGHGKHIRGASGYIDEVDEARKVVEQVAIFLRDLDIETTTYHDDVSTSQSENLTRIVDFHNSKTRDYDVSIHFNAYETTSKPMGSEVLYVTQENLADRVVDKICSASGLTNRGPKYRGDLKFLNSTEMPAILIETCFVDSQADVNIYHAEFHDICAAIAEGISGQSAQPIPPDTEPPETKPNLEGMQLRYLIGGDDTSSGATNEATELSYDAVRPPGRGVGVKYGNLFNEKYSEQSAAERAMYAPYMDPGDTAAEYGEGQIDPNGQGWEKNLDEQIDRALAQGFQIIEWDNPDSYAMEHVIGAVERTHSVGLWVMAKNPAICRGRREEYLSHPAVVGVVVEEDCGSPSEMQALRERAGVPTLPVWFVAYGDGEDWANQMATAIEDGGYVNMGVTYSSAGEYGNSQDVLLPGDIPEQPPAGVAKPTVKKGSSGPAVVELQKTLGVLVADGDFGSITDAWVRAFQGAAGLSKDGIVGPMTWNEVDALRVRQSIGAARLPKALADEIYTLAMESEIADYAWPDRGVAPPGYIPGMALAFAYAARELENEDPAAIVMAKAKGNPDKCALAWYDSEFRALGMSNSVAGVDTLRHLFVMMIGLGPRESSGRYCEGRDMSASNVESDTCEAGLFQTSWNIRNGSSVIEPLLGEFWQNPNGFLTEFKEGVTATASNLDSYGSGDGIKYQFLSRFAPLFHVMVTGVGMRVLRKHWGPIDRREVTLKREADELLLAVQALL